ncbi:hypothetical protein [Thermogemmatispora sp.]|uniref:TPM domain-containing protein n=1 Tax=Thermogemmatispora sp. TaxID=1968838 RepID=UPI0035E41CDA
MSGLVPRRPDGSRSEGSDRLTWLPGLLAGGLLGLLGLLMGLGLLLVGEGVALAADVTISDGAGVLDQGRIQREGAKLAYPLAIYTTNAFSGSQEDFEGYARGKVSEGRLIVLAIDTVHRWVYIEAGEEVPLSDSEAEEAYNAFKENYHNGDYTGATLAAIRSLEASLTETSSAQASGSGEASLTETPSSQVSGEEGVSSPAQSFDWSRVAFPLCFPCAMIVVFICSVFASASGVESTRRRSAYRNIDRQRYSNLFWAGTPWTSGGDSFGGSSGGSFGGDSGFGGSSGSSFGGDSGFGGSSGGSFGGDSGFGGSSGGSFGGDSGGGAGGSF